MAAGRWGSSLPSASPVQMVGEVGKQVPRVAKEGVVGVAGRGRGRGGREEGVVGVVGK